MAQLALFVACMVLAAGLGYGLRRAGLARRGWAKPVMSAAIIACDAPIAGLALWHLAIDADTWKIPVVGGAAAIAVSLLGLALAARLRLPRADQAVFGLQGGMGNVGYSLGGVLCLSLWGLQGLALEQMFCMMWPFYAFLFCFPLARHYGERAALETGAAEPAPHPPRRSRYVLGILGRSLTDLRSLPLYLATAGLALNLAGVVPPAAIQRSHVIEVLIFTGIVLQFGGVGLTVRVGQMLRYAKLALGTAGIKFLVHPLVMLGAAWAAGLEGVPLAVCLLLAAMPSALYSVLMANLFGLNRDLANTTFVLTHAICLAAVVPILAWFL